MKPMDLLEFVYTSALRSRSSGKTIHHRTAVSTSYSSPVSNDSRDLSTSLLTCRPGNTFT